MLDPIGVVFQLKDQASAPLGKLQNQLEQLHGTSSKAASAFERHGKQLLQGLGIMSHGAAGMYMLKGVSDDAARLESELAKLSLVADVTGHDLQRLAQGAVQLSGSAAFSPTQAIDGMRELAAAGFDVNETLAALPAVLRMANASMGKLTVTQAAATLTAPIKGYGFAVSETAHLADLLTQITQLSDLSSENLQESIGKISGVAHYLNQDFDTVLTALGLVTTAGYKAQMVAPKLRGLLLSFGSKQAADNARELGIALRTPTGEMRQLDAVVRDLMPKLQRMTASNKQMALTGLFGTSGNELFGPLFANAQFKTADKQAITGIDAFKTLRHELNRCDGIAAKFQNRLLDTTQGIDARLRHSLQGLRSMLGQPLLVPLKRVKKSLLGVVDVFVDLFSQSPQACEWLTGLVSAASALTLIVGGAFAAKAAFAMLGLAVGPLGAFLVATSLLLLKAAAVAAILGIAFYGVKKAFDHNLGGLHTALSKLFDRIGLMARALWGFFTKGGISESLKQQLDAASLIDTIESLLRIGRRFQTLWRGIKQGFMQGFEVLRPVLDAVLEPFSFYLDQIGKSFRWLISGFDDSNNSGKQFGDTLGELLSRGHDLGAFLGGLTASVATFISAVLSGIGMLVTGLIWALNALGWLGGKLLFGKRKDTTGGLLSHAGIGWGLADAQPWPISHKNQLQHAADTQPLTALFTEHPPQPLTPLPPTLPPTTPLADTAQYSPIQTMQTQHQHTQQLGQLLQSQQTLQQLLQEPTAQQTPLHVTTQINVDGRKMAQVVNQHNLRTNRRRGGQG